MGCGSSREVHPDSGARPTATAPSTRSNNVAGITSQTAINSALSPSTSRNQSNPRFGLGASGSNISTSRTSSLGHQRLQEEVSLTEHYNVPLTAPKPWSSTERSWTQMQLRREREEFFETRVTGQPEIWGALKEVTELIRRGDLIEAQGILDAAGCTLPTGKLEEGVYDERGMLYRVPANIITDPTNMLDDAETVVSEHSLSKKLEANESILSESLSVDGTSDEKTDKGKTAIEKDAMKVKCRLSDRGGPDTIVLLGKSQPVSVLLRRLRSEATIASSANVRIVYFGKILDESLTLDEQGWQQGHVIQALVSNFAP